MQKRFFHKKAYLHFIRIADANPGYVYTGPAEYLSGQILDRLSSRPKRRSLRHCVYTGPVSRVHDMRRVRIVPNLLLIQSDEFANVRNWRTKEKENEMNFILAEDSV